MRRIYFLLIAALLFAGLILFSKQGRDAQEVSRLPVELPEETPEIEVLAQNLEIPWETAFLPARPAGGPDGKIIFTERPGKVRILNVATQEISEVAHSARFLTEGGEGGLLGLALHPAFESNRFLYLYYTYRESFRILNKVVRYRLEGNSLVEDKTIIEEIPGSINHDGGRIRFGPDEKLYITTGDAGQRSLSQDRDSLAGKILRLNDDGSVPQDNPFATPIYSWGHRNPQGLAWDNRERLWATEHGQRNFDEVNLIEPGKNYGWPQFQGSDTAPGMQAPFFHSANSTWAPSGAIIYNNSLFFAGLAGRAIYELNLETKELKKHLEGEYGRLRTITLGPDGFFYLLTSNRDGRNRNPDPEDDRIIRVHPSVLGKN